MNVLFDKAAYEKGRSLKDDVADNTVGIENPENEEIEMKEGKIVKRALLDSIATGRVGSLLVDPQYLDFEALDCE